LFISKFDPDGLLLWVDTWGGPGDDFGGAASFDILNNIFACGSFQDTVDFDPGFEVDNHTSNGESDDFLLKVYPDGGWN